MKRFVLIVLVFSILGEIIPIPLIELNQLILVIGLFVYHRIIFNRIKYSSYKVFHLIVFLLIIFILFQGLLMSESMSEYFKFAKNYTLAFIFITLISILTYEEYLYIYNRFIIIASIFFIVEYLLFQFELYAIYNLLFLNPYQNLRHVANFLSPNSYAIVLVFLIIGNIHLSLRYKSIVNIVLVALLVLPLLSTFSRSGLILMFIALLGYLFTFGKAFIKIFISMSILCLYTFVVNGSLLSYLYNFTDSYYVRRFILYFESDNLLANRAIEFSEIFKLYSDQWIVGLGFSNISASSSIYDGMSSMHNEYLRFFIEGGLFAGLLFIILILIIVFNVFRIANQKIIKSELALVITNTLLFLLSQLQYNFFNAHREGLILIFFGLLSFALLDERNNKT